MIDAGKIRFTLSKDEILRSKKDIKELFDNGSSFFIYPYKVFYRANTSEKNQILISVSKRNFKKAVTRNKIKRHIREAYRLNKSLFANNTYNGVSFSIAIIYISKSVLTHKEIEGKLIAVLKKLVAAGGNLKK
ncbi:MAG: ribonuclease P protein component [Cyclobacteriaceae bacterium]